jgi:streptomycin 6-kinase
VLAERLKLSQVRIIEWSFAFAALSACWSDEDGGDPSLALSVARIAARQMRQQ